MRPRRVALFATVVLGGLLLGGVAQLAVFGPKHLLRSPMFGPLVERWLDHQEGTVAVGAPMPTLQLPALDGSARPVPTPGRATLVNYWASWCGPCIGEMPLLDRFASAQAAAPGGVEVVGVALDDAGPVRAFLAIQPVQFPILLEVPGPRDSSIRLGNHRNVLPFSVLVGTDGRVRARHYGAFEDAAQLRSWAAQAR